MLSNEPKINTKRCPKAPKGGSKMQCVQNLGCQLLLITNNESHTGYRYHHCYDDYHHHQIIIITVNTMCIVTERTHSITFRK